MGTGFDKVLQPRRRLPELHCSMACFFFRFDRPKRQNDRRDAARRAVHDG
jgi:hypothetical protein